MFDEITPHSTAEHDLVLALLALEQQLIDLTVLRQAMNVWKASRSKPLGLILREQDHLTVEQRVQLEATVEEYLDIDLNEQHEARSWTSSDSSSANPNESRHGFRCGSALSQLYSQSIQHRSDTHETRYRIIRRYAKGGLGEVFVAEDEELERRVAVKQIQQPHVDDPCVRSRFIREAKITGKLEHPGIVPVYGFGTYADGHPYYAMRLVNGENLKEAIDRYYSAASAGLEQAERGFVFRQLLRRFVDVCNAVAYAHSRGVVHRDLKPGNIMLGNFGETLIVDWGLAKPSTRSGGELLDSDSIIQSLDLALLDTHAGAAVGTPEYMSPEQAAGNGEASAPATDVYGLGATLYTILTGKAAFGDTERRSLVKAVQAGEFPRPRQRRPDVPPALDAVCCKAMALDPAGRYQTALEMASDIEHWLADEPVSAYTEPVRLRIGRFMRRHRTLTTSAAAILVVSIILSTSAALLLNVAHRNEQQARVDEAKQTEAAKESEQKAKASRQQASTIADFLIETLRSPDPSRDGRDIKVVELLDRAVDHVEKEFADNQAMRGRLFVVLGQTYVGLGLPAQAVKPLQSGVDLQREVLGHTHQDTLRAIKELHEAYRDAGYLEKEVQVAQELLKLEAATHGPEHPLVVTAMLRLGIAYDSVGRHSEATHLFDAITKSPIFDAQDFKHMNNVAVAHFHLGRYRESLGLYEDSLRIQKSLNGAEHPDTLMTAANLASVYKEMGRSAEAILLFENTLDSRRERLGPEHPDTLTSMDALAKSYLHVDRAVDALPLLEAGLKIAARKFGPDNSKTLNFMSGLASVYRHTRRLDDAICMMEEVVRLRKAKHGLHHRATLTHANNLAVFLIEAKRFNDAHTLLEDVVASRRQAFDENLDLGVTLMVLGGCLNHMGKFPEAEQRLKEGLAIQSIKNSNHWVHQSLQIVLGESLVAQARYTEAEPILITGYEMMPFNGESYSSHVRKARIRAIRTLIHLYKVTDRPAEAEKWRVKVRETEPSGRTNAN